MKTSLIYQLLAGGVKSIRVDGYIFFLRMGKVSHRKLSDSTSGKSWKRTEKRVKANKEFAGVRYMSSHMKDAYDGLPVWKHAAKYRTGTDKTSDNYRHRNTSGLVNELGEVDRISGRQVVSDGSLLLPLDMTMNRRGNVITLAWDDNRDTASSATVRHPARHSDRYDTSRRADVLPPRSTATRATGKVSFKVQAREGETLHVYPFFGNATDEAFSSNEYFLAPAEIDEPERAVVTDKFHTFTTAQEMNMDETLQEFFNDVYEITRQIPRGKVLTYGKIAVLAGRPQHARWVGRAMAQAPAERHAALPSCREQRRANRPGTAPTTRPTRKRGCHLPSQ